MPLRRRDLVALLLAAVTAFAGLAAWAIGVVDLGLVLGTDDAGRVSVVQVVPESIAARSGFAEGQLVTALVPIDGSKIQLHDPVPLPPEYGGGQLFLPAEAIPERLIGYVETGYVYEGESQVYPGVATLDRQTWQWRLGFGGWLAFMGIGFGALVAFALSRGWFGASWREEGTPFGVAIAIPFMATPLLYTGTPVGMAAAFLLSAAGALPAARSLADRHPVDRWPAALLGASAVVAFTVGLTTLRGLTTLEQAAGEPFDRVLLLAAVTLVPALAAAYGVDRASRERSELVLIGLGPGAAATILGFSFPNPAPFIGWLVIALGWRLATSVVGRFVEGMRGSAAPGSLPIQAAPPDGGGDTAGWRLAGLRARDLMALGIAIPTAIVGLVACCNTWGLITGSALGAIVVLALRRGFLGPAWKDAAIPVGCAVAVPILAANLYWGEAVFVLSSLGALPVAFLLAARHPDPTWRRILPFLSCGLAALATIVTVQFQIGERAFYGSGSLERYLLMGFIALVPGLVVAFRSSSVAGSQVTDRLDTLVVALTPGAAMTALVPSFGPVLLLAWLVGLIAWRRLTIAPLLGLAMRTQRQRDLAVAAVEAERARLAADLHDDALQELSALVRRLDSTGDTESAELARGVAERLRAITSDLRLPLLDDLGAGPALEWLVGRVRPLADGEVRLERADPQRPPAGVELAVFRVAQEALANAIKHGKPPITVRYRVDEAGSVSLSVDDEGPGIDPNAAEQALHAGHLGVANMQQRAEQIGALLDIRRWPAGGTHVALEWRPQ